MTAYDQLDGDDRALLRRLLREWLRAFDAGELGCRSPRLREARFGGQRKVGEGSDADIDALIALQAKGLISFHVEPEGDGLAFSVVVPPEVKAALAAQSGTLQ